MPFLNPAGTEDDIWDNLSKEEELRQQHIATASPQVAQRVGQIHSLYPGMAPGVKLAMAKAGFTDEQIEKIYPDAAKVALTDSVKEKPKKSWFQRNVMDKVKTGTRYGFAAANFPLDFVQGGLSQLFVDQEQDKTAGYWSSDTVAGWFISTDLGSLIANDEEAGSGFFIGGKAKELQAERARRYRGTVGGHAWTVGRGLANVAFEPDSMGFNIMSGALDAGMALWVPTIPFGKGGKEALFTLEEAGRGGAAVRGAVSALEKVGRGSTKISATRATVKEIDQMRADILVGNSVNFEAANKWFGTNVARRVIDRTSKTDNFKDVWDLWGRKIEPELAIAMAKESDPDKISAMLLDKLGQSRGLTDSLDFKGGNRFYKSLANRSKFIDSLGESGSRTARRAAKMPRRSFNLAQAETTIDKIDALNTVDRMLKLTLVDAATNKSLLNEAADLIVSKDRTAINGFYDKIDNVIKDSVTNQGVDREIVDAIFGEFQKLKSQAQRFNIDETYDAADAGMYGRLFGGVDPSAADVTFAGPQLTSELANNEYFIPDVRQIRRLTSNPLHRFVFAKAGKVGDPNIERLLEAGQLRLPFAFLDYVQQEVWRPFVTLTVGNFVRNTLDSQVMIALSHQPASSLFRHPWDYISSMRGNRKVVDLFGRDFDAAVSANDISDAQKALKVATTQQVGAQFENPITPYRKAKGLGMFHVSRRNFDPVADVVRGHGSEIGKLNADWAARTLASGKYTVQDLVNMVRSGDKDAVAWFDEMKSYYDAGRKTWNRATQRWSSETVDLMDDNNLLAVLDETAKRLERVTGQNGKLLDVVASGKVDELTLPGSTAGKMIQTSGYKPGDNVVIKGGKRYTYQATVKSVDPRTGDVVVQPFAFFKGGTTKELDDLLRSPAIYYNPQMPTRVVGEVIDPKNPAIERMTESKDRLVSKFHSYLYTQPIGKLERNPVFRDLYYKWVDELAPSLDMASIDGIIDDITQRAIASGKSPDSYVTKELWKKLLDLQSGKQPLYGTITREHLNEFASGMVLDEMSKMFYNATERGNGIDALRMISPFAQQQVEFLTRLGRTAFTPTRLANELGPLGYLPDIGVLRKSQLVVNGGTEADPDGNGRGFFYTDPVTNQWTFTFPMSGAVTNMLTGVRSEINAPVKGVALGLDYRPGLGPMATVAASAWLPDRPSTDFIRNFLLPYGERTNFLEAATPSWMRKVAQGISQDGKIYANVRAETMQALAASGEYNLSDVNDVDRLMSDASDKARVLTVLRGVSQFFGPAAGSYDQLVKTGKIDVYASQLAKVFQEMKQQDYDSAVPNFLKVFGEDAFIYISNKTKSQFGGLEASKQFGDFERDPKNDGLFRMFPDIAGYFGPTGSDFDFNVYQRQLSKGERKTLTTEELLKAAQETIGMSYYRAVRSQLPVNLNAEQQTFMSDYRKKLQKKYPGYGEMVFDPQRVPREIDKLIEASKLDTLNGNGTAEGVRAYAQVREAALAEAKNRGYNGLSANNVSDLRDYLANYAQAIIKVHPEFGRVYDRLLSREVEQ